MSRFNFHEFMDDVCEEAAGAVTEPTAHQLHEQAVADQFAADLDRAFAEAMRNHHLD